MHARKRQTVRTAVFSCLLLFLHSVAYGWYDAPYHSKGSPDMNAGLMQWELTSPRSRQGTLKPVIIFFNNNENREITPEQVLSQAARYNDPRAIWGSG